MAKLNMTPEQIKISKKAQEVLEQIEEVLEENKFEFVLEGENMFLRTKDEKNVFAVVDKSLGVGIRMQSVLLLPRTTDSQDLHPIILDGKDTRN